MGPREEVAGYLASAARVFVVVTGNMKLITGFLGLLYATLPLPAAGLENLPWTTTDGKVTVADCDKAGDGELIDPLSPPSAPPPNAA